MTAHKWLGEMQYYCLLDQLHGGNVHTCMCYSKVDGPCMHAYVLKAKLFNEDLKKGNH